MNVVKKLLGLFLPWPLRRIYLEKIFGYQIDPTARLGLNWVYPAYLEMAPGSRIDHLTVAIHLDQVVLGENAKIGRQNWITGFPCGTGSPHFQHDGSRVSALRLGRESAITKSHHIDCTSEVRIGKFVTIAGYRSQILTHSVNIKLGRQDSFPVEIGDYCFVGTACTILGGATLPSYSVLGASSLLNKKFTNEYSLYGGVPAEPKKLLSEDFHYFTRERGFII